MKKLFSVVASIGLFSFLTACSTTNPAGDRNIIVGTDGTYKVTDGNGDPVTDPDDPAAALAAALSVEMAKQNSLSDEEIWAIDTDGNRTHIQSGGICPTSWGSFELVRPSIFKRDGSDVGCNYQSDIGASFTFYYFKAPETAQTHAESAFENVKLRVPTGKPSELLIPLQFASYEAFGEVIRSTDSAGYEYNDGLFVAETDGWLVKLRATYLTGRAAEIESVMQAMYLGAIESVTPEGYSPPLKDQPGDEDKLGT